MSRIGKLPIDIPKGVDVKLQGSTLTVKGPKGKLEKSFDKEMLIEIEDSIITVKRPSENKTHKALHGLTRSLIYNMVVGVTEGFQKVLEVNGVGYRIQKQEDKIVLNVGYSHPVEIMEPSDIVFEVPTQNKIIVQGIDKQQVGLVAANIRSVRPPEPYKGKGIKYDYEKIKRKEGKAAK